MKQEHPASNAFLVRDRLLAYLSGMDIDPVDSLELAAECLRRAGPECDCRVAMDMLETVLVESGRTLPGSGDGRPELCAPAMVRSSMLACDLSSPGLFGMARSAAYKCLCAATPWRSPWGRA